MKKAAIDTTDIEKAAGATRWRIIRMIQRMVEAEEVGIDRHVDVNGVPFISASELIADIRAMGKRNRRPVER